MKKLKERRDFLKILGLSSGIAMLPTEIIASVSSKDKEISDLLGHKIDIVPKKIIDSLDDIGNERVLKNSLIENEYANKLKFNNFNIFKKVSHKTDKSIFMYNQHTGEIINLVYWSQGKYIKENLNKINYFMRDFRENKVKKINLKTLEAIHQVSEHTKKGVPLVLNSAYRSPKTNRLVGGAKHSQHLEGSAIDFSKDKKDHTSLGSLRRFLISHHNGGVGYYPRQGFIHVDAGDKRKWRG